MWRALFRLPRPRDAWEGYEVLQSVCLYICLSVCLSDRISQRPYVQTSLNYLCILPVVVHSFRGTSLAMRQYLCTSGFADDAMFPHNGATPWTIFQTPMASSQITRQSMRTIVDAQVCETEINTLICHKIAKTIKTQEQEEQQRRKVSNEPLTLLRRGPKHARKMVIKCRAGFKCVEALGRIIIRGPYPPSNAIIYMHLQL